MTTEQLNINAQNTNILDFGILTLATKNDYLKAIALALSLRVSNPGVPIAIACSKKVGELVAPYFDYVIEEQAGLKGFVHKVYLDIYSPFKNSVFFDSDVLVFRAVKPYADAWSDQAYCAIGTYFTDGIGSFGLDRVNILKKINKPKLVELGGAGHAFFKKPQCSAVFDLAREVTANYHEIAGGIPYADEDVMNIVMTQMDLHPIENDATFMSRYFSAKFGTMKMDAAKGSCSYVWVDNGQLLKPCMTHFACNEAPFAYTYQMYKLFKKFNVPTKGLFKLAVHDGYELYIKNRLHPLVSKLRRIFKAK